MKRLFTLIAFCSTIGVFAQQDIQFTQYMFNKVFYNPGVTASDGYITANLLGRTQWVGFDGAPQTLNVNVQVPLGFLHGGLGVGFVKEEIGFFNNTTFKLSYAYQAIVGDGVLGIGISGGFNSQGLNSTDWLLPNGTNSDNFVPDGDDASAFTPDIAFGAYYRTNDYYVGLSTSHLTEFESDFNNVSEFNASRVKQERHYYFMAGYDFVLDPAIETWILTPSVFVKTDLISTQVDINATVLYNSKIWLGLGYRLDDAFAVLFGYNLTEDLRFGYSYDVTTSKLSGGSNGSSGSHEVMLSYKFKIEIPPRPPQRYVDPRFLE